VGRGYQERDYEIVDYHLWKFDGLDREVRGPRPRTFEPQQYFVCLGAAQTFGCFTDETFPTLLARGIGLDVLNLGTAGAGPLFFLRNLDALRPYLDGARFVVVQVMSGRSEDNRVFQSSGFEYGWRRSDGERIGAAPVWQEALEQHGPDFARELLAETRENWLTHFEQLLRAIAAPRILFWFSKRTPADHGDDVSSIDALFGQFPHLVNAEMVEQIKPWADEYVECVTSRGMPQPLFSRFTGEPVTIRGRADLGGEESAVNAYYPSPEMHEDAAAKLLPVCALYAARVRA
jgi:hypothetical protein